MLTAPFQWDPHTLEERPRFDVNPPKNRLLNPRIDAPLSRKTTGPAHQSKPVVVQRKTVVSAQSVKQTRKPTTPSPIYRPQPVPKVLQTKSSLVPQPKQATTTNSVSQRKWTTQPPAAINTRPVIQQMEVKRRGPVKHRATANGMDRDRNRKTKTKPSGDGLQLARDLLAGGRFSEARKFHSLVGSFPNKRPGQGWHPFDCAEAQVVGALVKSNPEILLHTIRITQIEFGGAPRNPCINCLQWLEWDAGGYRVKDPNRRAPAVVPIAVGAPAAPPVVPAAVGVAAGPAAAVAAAPAAAARADDDRGPIDLRERAKKKNIFEYLEES